jgi:hypothetical protein
LVSDTNAKGEIDVFGGKVLRIYERKRKTERVEGRWEKNGRRGKEEWESCIMWLIIIYIQILW